MYFSNINKTDSIWKRIRGLKWTYVFLFSVTLAHAASNWKFLNDEISDEKKNGPTKYALKKNFGPTEYSRGIILDPRRHDGTRPTMTCDHQ